jgi:PAS domain-containing protein
VTVSRQKHLILILAREFASNLATPTLIVDAGGQVVFYNEAAEDVLGRSFAETGEIALDEFGASFAPRTEDDVPIPAEERPPRIAFDERRPAHQQYWITSRDGVRRQVSVTAFPLFANAEEFVGIVVIFWREAEAGG